jgi:hypothetical protein
MSKTGIVVGNGLTQKLMLAAAEHLLRSLSSMKQYLTMGIGRQQMYEYCRPMLKTFKPFFTPIELNHCNPFRLN